SQIIDVLKNMCAEHGTSVMLITHDMGVIADTTDRVTVMYAGKVVESGPMAATLTSPAHPYTMGLRNAFPDLARAAGELTPIHGAPPNLMFVPDRDGDDVPDGEPEIRLDGWNINDRHETLNSFVWGPDGWLYGAHGVFTHSNVGKPKDGGRVIKFGESYPKHDNQGRTKINCGIWRYHPVKDRFEVFAHGLSNPWGFDFNAKGQLFATACVIPHLWHVIQGGVYHRQGGRHFNPYVYDDIKTIRDHAHKSAHGGARVYLADLFPPEYYGRLFMANIHQHEVLTDILEPKGSGFVGKHGDDFLQANDKQWIGFSVETGPEGAVYVLDWHDSDICGRKIVHGKTGRIYRLAPKGAKGVTGLDLAKKSDVELAQLQTHVNRWYARRARVLLQSRAADKTLKAEGREALWNIYREDKDVTHRLRALWCLHATDSVTAEQLMEQLSDQDPHIRAWSIQMLCEDMKPSADAIAKFVKMAQEDESQVVRLYLASALQRMPLESRWDLARHLVTHAEDVDDHNLPKMYWYGIEPLVPENRQEALKLAAMSKIPLIRQFIARRMTAGQGQAKPSDMRTESLKLFSKIGPGFSTRESGERGVALVKSHRGRDAVRTHPVNRNTPCVLRKRMKVPADKTTTLNLAVSYHPHGDWQLLAFVNQKQVASHIIGHETTTDGWADVSVDLSDYAGKQVVIDLENKANNWHNEWAYWGKIEIVSE
ncbi:MAG: PVC-type heme-binding CxxCH protein, partial [Verrucomicrobiota bacterium]